MSSSGLFSCLSREYKYFFWRENLNLLAMEEADNRFLGEHDFRNFSKMDAVNVHNYKRHITLFEICPSDVRLSLKKGAQLVVLEGKCRNVWESVWSNSCLDLHRVFSGAARALPASLINSYSNGRTYKLNSKSLRRMFQLVKGETSVLKRRALISTQTATCLSQMKEKMLSPQPLEGYHGVDKEDLYTLRDWENLIPTSLRKDRSVRYHAY